LVTFIDSSAFYAYLDARDENHQLARETLTELIEARDDLVTHNYVVVESSALIQRRLGAEAVRVFFDDVLPATRVLWIDEPMHRLALAAMLGSLTRGVSLVDWTSFVTMRELGIDRAFVFDADFESQGLQVIPAP
jgi:predicted nucleic acid-binding protein